MSSHIKVERLEDVEYGVLIAGEDCSLLYVDDTALTFLGRDGDSANTNPCWRFASLQTRDGRSFCGPDCPLWKRLRAGKSLPRRHLSFVTDSGDSLYVLTSLLTPMSGTGKAILHFLIQPPAPKVLPALSDAEVSRSTSRDGVSERLSDRQNEVLQLLASGLSTEEIADKLFIHPITVRNHVQSILKKLNVHRRLDAVLAWIHESE